MTIFRTEHKKNYTVVNNFIFKDFRLSWKAKGIWMYAFSRPDDWEFHLSDILKQSTDGKDSVTAGLKELEECGYLQRSRNRDSKGKMLPGAEWVFHETPQLTDTSEPKPENPILDNPTLENPILDNPPLISNDLKPTTETPSNIEKQQCSDVGSLDPDVKVLAEELEKALSEAEKPTVKTQAFNWLLKLGFDALAATFLVSNYSSQEIQKASGYVQKQIEKKKKKNEIIHDVIGYFRRTLENKWWEAKA